MDTTVRFRAFLDEALRQYSREPNLRKGQSFMETLYFWDEELYKEIKDTRADCSSSDERIGRFMDQVMHKLPEYTSACSHTEARAALPNACTMCKKRLEETQPKE